jgi:hypothetical protein
MSYLHSFSHLIRSSALLVPTPTARAAGVDSDLFYASAVCESNIAEGMNFTEAAL